MICELDRTIHPLRNTGEASNQANLFTFGVRLYDASNPTYKLRVKGFWERHTYCCQVSFSNDVLAFVGVVFSFQALNCHAKDCFL